MRACAVLTVLTVLSLLAACYRPSFSNECAVRCGAGDACPAGLTCDTAEGFCQSDLAATCSHPPDGGVPPGTDAYRAVTGGLGHACAIRSDGALVCWGLGDDGQLGDGQRQRRGAPVRVGDASDWLAVDAGDWFTCGIRGAALPGDVYCWGDNFFRQVMASDTTPVPLPQKITVPGRTFKAVSAGNSTACAIDDADHLWCWGANQHHQTGTGPNLGEVKKPPTQVGSLTWQAISVGYSHACGISGGALLCWGENYSGPVLGAPDMMDHDTPTMIDPGPGWTQVVATDVFSCALKNGERWCWGRNSGNFGDGMGGFDEHTPTRVGFEDDWLTITAGGRHSCGVRAAGPNALWCWGLNGSGQVGTGDRVDEASPTQVGGSDEWTAVAALTDATCALRADGAVFCWGDDGYGQNGNGRIAAEPAPVRVGDETGWTALALGDTHTCGLRGGALYCWGENRYGQLGLGDLADQTAPRGVAGAWKAVAAGAHHTCAIDDADVLKCWGLNENGALGTGASTDVLPRPTPTAVAGGPAAWNAVSGGGGSTCAVGSDAMLYCWGDAFEQKLGLGSDEMAYATPQAVSVQGAWTAVAVGRDHACGLRTGAATSELWCWGGNDRGQRADSTEGTPPSGTPTLTAAMAVAANWTSIAGNYLHHCGIRAGTDLLCWGGGGLGQIGNNDVFNATTPQAPLESGPWRAAAAGFVHSCAIKQNGTLWCWGGDDHGEIADGVPDALIQDRPKKVGADADWRDLALGMEHACAIKTDSSLWCWGSNQQGQIGNGESSALGPATGRIADAAE